MTISAGEWIIAIAALGAGTLFLAVAVAVLRALCSRPISGAEGMVREVGVARTELAPEGRVTVKGRAWGARTLGEPIPKGSRVRVESVSGLALIVTPARETDRGEDGMSEQLEAALYPSGQPRLGALPSQRSQDEPKLP